MEVYHQKRWSNQDPFNFKYQMTFFFEDFTVMCCKFLSQKNQNNFLGNSMSRILELDEKKLLLLMQTQESFQSNLLLCADETAQANMPQDKRKGSM